MDGKKSFLLYCDQIGLFKQLPDAQAGKLIKLIFEYVNDNNPKVDDLLLKIAFEPIKLQLKRDLKGWNNVREVRSIAGKKGGEASGKVRQKKANEASASKSKQNEANEAVTVNVTVNDKVKDTNTIISNSIDARKVKFIFDCSKENTEKRIIPSADLIAPPGDYRQTFTNYWTEIKPKGRKMRFEKCDVFNIPMRLTTWKGNLKPINSNQNETRRERFQAVHDELQQVVDGLSGQSE